jgi:hypothetical protein
LRHIITDWKIEKQAKDERKKNIFLIRYIKYLYMAFLKEKPVFLVSLGGVRLSPLGTSATVGLLYQPRMIDDDDDDDMEQSVE